MSVESGMYSYIHALSHNGIEWLLFNLDRTDILRLIALGYEDNIIKDEDIINAANVK